LHEQHASQRGLVMRACVPAKRRSPPCLRCQRLSTYACILVLGISATQCHSWLRLWMASEPQDAAVKMRTLPRQLLRCQQGQGGSSSRQVDAAFASEAPRGLEEQFLEHQTTLPMMMAVILLCVGLMARQDAIIIFALFQFFCVMNSRSILQCLAAWKRVSSDMLEIYGDFAVVQPVLAKSLTSGVAYVLGDLIAQRVEGQPVINVGRCTHNGITGRRGTAHASGCDPRGCKRQALRYLGASCLSEDHFPIYLAMEIVYWRFWQKLPWTRPSSLQP